jgi:hypothetical protein
LAFVRRNASAAADDVANVAALPVAAAAGATIVIDFAIDRALMAVIVLKIVIRALRTRAAFGLAI